MHVDVLVRDTCYWDFFEISPFPIINNRHKLKRQGQRSARVSGDGFHEDAHFVYDYFDVYPCDF